MFDSTKSLEQLENDYWKHLDFPTTLIEKCFLYRKIPIQDLTIEQLRLLIGQNVGLKFLIPRAIEILKSNIFAEGDFYEGDLLAVTLSTSTNYWEEDLGIREEFLNLLKDKYSDISDKSKSLLKATNKFISL